MVVTFWLTPKGLKGADITFPCVSVGATENIMMAAALADSETKLIDTAREPEIIDLANCLTSMGASIEGIGSDTIVINGRGYFVVRITQLYLTE